MLGLVGHTVAYLRFLLVLVVFFFLHAMMPHPLPLACWILGNFFLTVARTLRFSLAVPCAATIAKAMRACVLSGIGYFFRPGSANEVAFMRFRVEFLSFAITLPFTRSNRAVNASHYHLEP